MSKQPIKLYQNFSTIPQTMFNAGNHMQVSQNGYLMNNKNSFMSNIMKGHLMQLKNKNCTPISAEPFNTIPNNVQQLHKINNANFNFITFNTRAPRRTNKNLNDKDKNKKSSKYGKKFTPDEDEQLKKLVETMGTQKWDLIAKEMPGRNGRQCRDRYKNYLMPGYFIGQWSIEEDLILRKKYYEYGPQWSKITEFLKNRSSNAVKNRWNYFVSKHLEEEFDLMQHGPEIKNEKYNEKIKNQSKSEENQKSFEINNFFDLFNNNDDDENENDFNINDEYFEFSYLYEN